MAALRAADVDLEDETMMELEMIFASIARKLASFATRISSTQAYGFSASITRNGGKSKV